MKICPKCNNTEVSTYSKTLDICFDCDEVFPTVEDQKEIYCHPCSKAGGAERAIYHLPPACKGD